MAGGHQSQEEDLMDIKQKILEEKRDYLCRLLKPETHFPYLRSVYTLSQDDVEIIQNEITTKAKANKFLDILSTKGPDSYEQLVHSLIKDKTQMFIVEKLNKEFERRKSIYQGKTASQRVDLIVNTRQLPKPQKSTTKNDEKSDQNKLTVGHGQERKPDEVSHHVTVRGNSVESVPYTANIQQDGPRGITPDQQDELEHNRTIPKQYCESSPDSLLHKDTPQQHGQREITQDRIHNSDNQNCEPFQDQLNISDCKKYKSCNSENENGGQRYKQPPDTNVNIRLEELTIKPDETNA